MIEKKEIKLEDIIANGYSSEEAENIVNLSNKYNINMTEPILKTLLSMSNIKIKQAYIGEKRGIFDLAETVLINLDNDSVIRGFFANNPTESQLTNCVKYYEKYAELIRVENIAPSNKGFEEFAEYWLTNDIPEGLFDEFIVRLEEICGQDYHKVLSQKILSNVVSPEYVKKAIGVSRKMHNFYAAILIDKLEDYYLEDYYLDKLPPLMPSIFSIPGRKPRAEVVNSNISISEKKDYFTLLSICEMDDHDLEGFEEAKKKLWKKVKQNIKQFLNLKSLPQLSSEEAKWIHSDRYKKFGFELKQLNRQFEDQENFKWLTKKSIKLLAELVMQKGKRDFLVPNVLIDSIKQLYNNNKIELIDSLGELLKKTQCDYRVPYCISKIQVTSERFKELLKAVDIVDKDHMHIFLKHAGDYQKKELNLLKVAELLNYGDKMPSSELKEFINSNIKVEDKIVYINMARILKINPESNEEWFENAKKNIKDMFDKEYDLNNFPDISIEKKGYILSFREENDGKLLKRILKQGVKKNFETNKIYKVLQGQVKVKRVSPYKATEYLVVGLLGSRDKTKVKESNEFFAENVHKIKSAMKYMKDSGHSKKIFNEMSEKIKDIKGNSREIIDYLKSICKDSDSRKVEPLSDLVNAVEALFTKQERYDALHYKTQSGTLDDLFNNRTTMCCSFLPSGESKESSLVYLYDSNVALIPLIPIADKKYLDPIGVAITCFVKDKNKKKGLLVDSVEGGNGLPKTWKEDYYEVIKEFAKDNGCKYVMYNNELGNGKPKIFGEFLDKKGIKLTKKYVSKVGGIKQTKRYEPDGIYLESFNGEEEPEGRVKGHLVELK